MAKRKNKRSRAKKTEPKPGWFASLEPEMKQRIGRGAVQLVLLAAVAVGIALGMAELDRRVHADDRFLGPPAIELVGIPPDLEEVIRERVLVSVDDADWTEPELCRRLAANLAESGWVAGVERVRRLSDRRIEVRCRYRTPFAMVQSDGGFLLVDSYGVRLPGRYPYSPRLPLVQGVGGGAPEAGREWTAKDLSAALGVLSRLRAEPFADQVTAVLVHNYGGRRDRHAAHLELATDRAGGRIIWGSAPGEEIEENSAAQKLAILRRNHELHGRADAGLPVIDVTTFPDRFTTPTQAGRSMAGSPIRA